MSEKIELEILEGLYVVKPSAWVMHKRAKNYIARIDGTDRKFGFSRKFLERMKLGNTSYFQRSDFEEGVVYEIRCVYYSGGGHASTELEGYFECSSVTDTLVTLEQIGEEEVIKYATKRDAEKKAEAEQRAMQIEESELIMPPAQISIRDLSEEEIATLMATLMKEMRRRGMGVQIV